MIKVIASDMDGTLLNSDIRVASENVKRLNTQDQKGFILFYVLVECMMTQWG
ncbi:Uncharacterised protein [Listeria fleischmannii subsp. fleischmannii]|uniref:Uncharacterized protein n=1 Tax=Listeria fleischmannii subsp. fleischmannii TaxID=1671902 RepID=A0A2X3GH25_9LIST|nr:Uncharacterised protein [Listeria fleischmannii subsp. fleischmannii]